ncbi:protein of unknown function [Thiomonas sp. Sup16B3]|nr:protein of unknown function [Thiomonas sp. Sup16B3]VDY15799.1 protein of unknown function [Thiomonas sp. CB2]
MVDVSRRSMPSQFLLFFHQLGISVVSRRCPSLMTVPTFLMTILWTEVLAEYVRGEGTINSAGSAQIIEGGRPASGRHGTVPAGARGFESLDLPAHGQRPRKRVFTGLPS